MSGHAAMSFSRPARTSASRQKHTRQHSNRLWASSGQHNSHHARQVAAACFHAGPRSNEDSALMAQNNQTLPAWTLHGPLWTPHVLTATVWEIMKIPLSSSGCMTPVLLWPPLPLHPPGPLWLQAEAGHAAIMAQLQNIHSQSAPRE